jgi:hypothetical protein
MIRHLVRSVIDKAQGAIDAAQQLVRQKVFRQSPISQETQGDGKHQNPEEAEKSASEERKSERDQKTFSEEKQGKKTFSDVEEESVEKTIQVLSDKDLKPRSSLVDRVQPLAQEAYSFGGSSDWLLRRSGGALANVSVSGVGLPIDPDAWAKAHPVDDELELGLLSDDLGEPSMVLLARSPRELFCHWTLSEAWRSERDALSIVLFVGSKPLASKRLSDLAAERCYLRVVDAAGIFSAAILHPRERKPILQSNPIALTLPEDWKEAPPVFVSLEMDAALEAQSERVVWTALPEEESDILYVPHHTPAPLTWSQEAKTRAWVTHEVEEATWVYSGGQSLQSPPSHAQEAKSVREASKEEDAVMGRKN